MNQKTLLIFACIGIGGYLLFKRRVVQSAGNLSAVSAFDAAMRENLEAKNWLLDQMKVVKEPYFSPDP